MNRFQFVADHQQRYGVKRLCTVIGVSRSSFYYWRSAAEARAVREAANVVLVGRIRAVHTAHDGTYALRARPVQVRILDCDNALRQRADVEAAAEFGAGEHCLSKTHPAESALRADGPLADRSVHLDGLRDGQEMGVGDRA